mgnify:CR=1 FL=1
MKGKLCKAPVVDATQTPEFLHASEQALNRRVFVVQGNPLGGISQNPRMLPEVQRPKMRFVPM